MIFELIILFITPILFWGIRRELSLPRWIGLDLFLLCAIIAGHFYGQIAGIFIGLSPPLFFALRKMDLNLIVGSFVLGFSGFLASTISLSFILKGILITLVYIVLCHLFLFLMGRSSIKFGLSYFVSNFLLIILFSRWFL